MIDRLIDEIFKGHRAMPPLPDERRLSLLAGVPFRIPRDVARFYSRCDGARLFDPGDSRYDFVRLEDFRRIRIDISGIDEDAWGPAGWYSICNVQDGNYAALDLARATDEGCPVMDCFHETFGQPGHEKVIANSLTEFLDRALRSGNRLFWLA